MRRPYVPLRVRIIVLERQIAETNAFIDLDERDAHLEWVRMKTANTSLRKRVAALLDHLFWGEKAELDHDPALELRRYNKRTGKYSPDANNPKYLVYRLKAEHLQKTVGRKPGAERTITTKGSDVWLAKKFRKLAKPKGSRSKIPSRPFPKGRSSFATRAGKGS